MFATEPVTASLSGLLQEKDDQEKAGGVAGRPSRYVVEEADGQRRRRELEIDELEIQKGLLQIAQGLEFLHESAGLVHGNLTPDAIFVNVKVCPPVCIQPVRPILTLSLCTVGLENSGIGVRGPSRHFQLAIVNGPNFSFRSLVS